MGLPRLIHVILYVLLYLLSFTLLLHFRSSVHITLTLGVAQSFFFVVLGPTSSHFVSPPSITLQLYRYAYIRAVRLTNTTEMIPIKSVNVDTPQFWDVHVVIANKIQINAPKNLSGTTLSAVLRQIICPRFPGFKFFFPTFLCRGGPLKGVLVFIDRPNTRQPSASSKQSQRARRQATKNDRYPRAIRYSKAYLYKVRKSRIVFPCGCGRLDFWT